MKHRAYGGNLLKKTLAALKSPRPTTVIEAAHGQFTITHVKGKSGVACVVLHTGLDGSEDLVPTVRIHSSCLFGEAFYSEECDCRAQLDAALTEISERGGALVYAFQEGRGTSLCAKIVAMELQRVQRLSTVEAFDRLGYTPDPRAYDAAIEALHAIGIAGRIRAITNNPLKMKSLQAAGFDIVERVEPYLTLDRRTASLVRAKQIALGQIPYRHIRFTRPK